MIPSWGALLREERVALSFGVACAFLSGPGQTFFISLFVGPIAEDLHLGAAGLGSLYLAATLGAACLMPFAGHWIDRVDLRRYFTLVALGLAAACGVMALAAGPAGLFLAFLLLRLHGQGLMTHVAVTSIARHLDSHRGRGLSLVSMGFPLSEAVMPAMAVTAMAVLGWRLTYAAVGVAIVLLAVPLVIRLIRRVPDFTAPAAGDGSGIRARALDGLRIVVPTQFFWFALPVLVYLPFSATALIFHLQPLVAAKGWSAELVAPGFTGYAVGHAGGLLLSGGLIDRFGGRNVLSLLNLPMLAGVALLALLDASVVLVLFLGLMGLSSGLAQPTVAAAWAEVYGVSRLGATRSFAVMLMVAGTSLGPAALGPAIDARLPVGVIGAVFLAAGLAAALAAWLGARRADSAA